MANGDDVRIDASLQDDISAALAKIEQRIKSVEDAVGKLGRKGAQGGEEFAAGVNKAARAADDLGDQSRQAKREVDDLGDKAGKAGGKAAAGSTGLELFAKKAKKAGKEAGGLSTILQTFKIAGIVTGVFALAGGISALGAGAVIAIGAISPLIGVLAVALPIFAAAKLGMLAWKLAASQLEMPLTRIKNQFTELGPVIARGGLASGVNYFADSIGKLAKATGTGLAGLGAEMGLAARNAGDIAKSAPFLNQVASIFAGLRPIFKFVLSGLIAIAQSLLNLLQAALPAAQGMAAAFEWVATSLRNWTAAQLANGKMAAFITHAWEMFLQICGIVVDVVIGLYNVFKIGAGFIGNMGQSIHDAAWEFRQWTTSAEGQARITKYFQDSLPALQEMGKLLKFVTVGLGGLGANQNVAPLLAQINSQLLPALMNLINNLAGQGGLGPALISAATALAQLFSGLDFSGLAMFAAAINGILQALVWLQQNVPGANFVISSLLMSFLGFKALGPVFSIIGRGADAFVWMKTAAAATGELTFAQKIFQGAIGPLGTMFSKLGGVVMNVVVPALRMIAIAGVGALRTLSTALFTTPVGWIILAIIAIIAAIYLLWTKCAWFRDLVMAVWGAIKTAAIATWNALKTAFFAVVDALVTAWNAVRDAFVAVWDWLKTAWQNTVDFFIMVGMWIWDHGLKQVLAVIITYFTITFNIIKFIVQTAIYIIVAIIVVIATILKGTWDGIVMVATWAWGKIVEGAMFLWNYGIKPLVDGFIMIWNFLWGVVTGVATWAWGMIVAGAMLFWNYGIKPLVDGFITIWNFLWGVVTGVATWAWGLVTAGATWLFNKVSEGINWLWNTILNPVFTTIGNAGAFVWSKITEAASTVWGKVTEVWNTISNFLSGIWSGITAKGTAVWDAIKSAANTVGDVIKGVWNGIKSAVAGVWNFIARGWNSIPDISVPDWIPIIGGKTFSLPKLPTLWHGGEAPGGTAIVGEHGPEPLVQNGAVTRMVGLNGPEITGIPKGGYVVPNLRTLNALPGLAKTLPSGVAAAVARSMPGYAGALSGSSSGGGSGGGATAALAAQVGRLAVAVASQQPSVHVDGAGDVYSQVVAARRAIEREDKLKGRYHYQAGSG